MKLVTAADLKISASNFDLTNPINTIRIVAGFCFFPHALSKFADGGLNPAFIAFFTKASFTYPSPAFWLCLAAFSEILSGITLILGICTRWMGIFAAVALIFAIYGLFVVNSGFKWTWNTGGIEYPTVWAITCLSVALNGWKNFLK